MLKRVTPPPFGSQGLSAGLSSSRLAWVSSSASRPGLSVGGAAGAPPRGYYWRRGVGKAGSGRPARAGFVAAPRRRGGGGSRREAGGAAGARPRAPGGRIVFLRGAAAGVGAATGTLGSPDPTAPRSPDPSSIQLRRSSHLARAPTTDCEVGAVRGHCPPAAISVPLARISEQVPGAGTRLLGGREDGAPQAGGESRSARGTREMPALGVPGWRTASAELGCAEGGGGLAGPRHCAVGAGSGRPCPPGFSGSLPLERGARKGMT